MAPEEELLKETIYRNFIGVVSKIGKVAPHKMECSMYLQSKLYGVELFKNNTLDSIDLLKKAYVEERKEDKIVLDRVGNYLSETMVYYEAYLNSVYSFFEILSLVTPHFYDPKKIRGDFPYRSFRDQRNYLLKHHDVDPAFSDYLSTFKLLTTLENDRHAITHNVSPFLGFGTNGEIIRIVMHNKRINFWEKKKEYVNIENEVVDLWEELFKFLDFYVTHFQEKEVFWTSESIEALERLKKNATS